MPRWKYVSNRALTLAENLILRHKLSEYHTGLRAFSRKRSSKRFTKFNVMWFGSVIA